MKWLAGAAITALAVAGAVSQPAQAANQLNKSFTSNGVTSTYHIFDEGLDASKPIGLMMYTDGSGAYGIKNPNSTYLLDADGNNGLVATARKHNMVLVVPKAPGPWSESTCEGVDNCWYDSNAVAKAKWSSDLMTSVKSQYNIDNRRIVVGGYSSGAQWTTRWFLPLHGEAQSVDLAVPIAFGGNPANGVNASSAYKQEVVVSWDTGKNDNTGAYSTAAYGARGGYNWYTTNGWKTDYVWTGDTHDRSGQFAGIMDREITQHLGTAPTLPTPTPSQTPTPSPTPTSTSTPSPTPSPTPTNASWNTSVVSYGYGVRATVNIPSNHQGRTYLWVRHPNGVNYWYNYTTSTGVRTITINDSYDRMPTGVTYNYTIENSNGNVYSSGTVTR